jgi:hypothetical protein
MTVITRNQSRREESINGKGINKLATIIATPKTAITVTTQATRMT